MHMLVISNNGNNSALQKYLKRQIFINFSKIMGWPLAIGGLKNPEIPPPPDKLKRNHFSWFVMFKFKNKNNIFCSCSSQEAPEILHFFVFSRWMTVAILDI